MRWANTGRHALLQMAASEKYHCPLWPKSTRRVLRTGQKRPLAYDSRTNARHRFRKARFERCCRPDGWFMRIKLRELSFCGERTAARFHSRRSCESVRGAAAESAKPCRCIKGADHRFFKRRCIKATGLRVFAGFESFEGPILRLKTTRIGC
jgi:hypothetical protein